MGGSDKFGLIFISMPEYAHDEFFSPSRNDLIITTYDSISLVQNSFIRLNVSIVMLNCAHKHI